MLAAEKTSLLERYAAFQNQGLHLNMSRGIPSKEQLDLSQVKTSCERSSCSLDGMPRDMFRCRP